jgi:hypothetical protein
MRAGEVRRCGDYNARYFDEVLTSAMPTFSLYQADRFLSRSQHHPRHIRAPNTSPSPYPIRSTDPPSLIEQQ